MKKENFSAGKCCENDKKAMERSLTKKRNSLIEVFVKRKRKREHLERSYTHPRRLRRY